MRLRSKAKLTCFRKQHGNVMAEYMMVAVTVMIAFYFAAVGWTPGDKNGLINKDLPDVTGQADAVPGMIDAMKTQQNNFIHELAKP